MWRARKPKSESPLHVTQGVKGQVKSLDGQEAKAEVEEQKTIPSFIFFSDSFSLCSQNDSGFTRQNQKKKKKQTKLFLRFG